MFINLKTSILKLVNAFRQRFVFISMCDLNNAFYFQLFCKNLSFLIRDLALIQVGFLGGRFEVWRGGKITPCLKPVTIMLETSNLTRKYTPICNFRKYTSVPLILLMSAFFCKNLPLFVQNSTSNPSNSVRAVLEIFSSVFSFCKKKGCYY